MTVITKKGKIVKMGEVEVSKISGFHVDGMEGDDLKKWILTECERLPFRVRLAE